MTNIDPHSLAALLQWLDSDGMGVNSRFARSAFASMIDDTFDKSIDARTLLNSLRDMREPTMKRLNVSERTARDYEGRIRSAINAYYTHIGEPPDKAARQRRSKTEMRTTEPERDSGASNRGIAPMATVPPRAKTMDEQIAEALVAMSKWPDLLEFLLPGIIQAKQTGKREAGNHTTGQ